MRTMQVAAMLMYNSNVHALGLETAQGLILTELLLGPERPHPRLHGPVKAKTPNQWPNMVAGGRLRAPRCTI